MDDDLVALAHYLIQGQVYAASDARLQDALARVYGSSERARCMCVPGGVEMYVAQHGEFVIKRMPQTGRLHRACCPSFDPEPGTSGLGELLGDAIIEHASGEVELKTAFPLERHARQGCRGVERAGEPAAVSAPTKRMSLRALLHFLYDRAGFNRWYPAMAGRRSQAVVRHHLLSAADGVTLKGGRLRDCLFIPEQFKVSEAQEIAVRRRQQLGALCASDGIQQFKSAILIGQFAAFEETAFGCRVVVKHMPDAPLRIDQKTWLGAVRSFGPTLQALDADLEHKPRVLMAALIHAKREHVYEIHSLTLMLVSQEWLPLEGLHELPLVERLIQDGRAFLKPLRFDARTWAVFPNVLLLDTEAPPTPLHVVSAFMSEKERTTKDKAINASGKGTWFWRTEQAMPNLPLRGFDR